MWWDSDGTCSMQSVTKRRMLACLPALRRAARPNCSQAGAVLSQWILPSLLRLQHSQGTSHLYTVNGILCVLRVADMDTVSEAGGPQSSNDELWDLTLPPPAAQDIGLQVMDERTVRVQSGYPLPQHHSTPVLLQQILQQGHPRFQGRGVHLLAAQQHALCILQNAPPACSATQLTTWGMQCVLPGFLQCIKGRQLAYAGRGACLHHLCRSDPHLQQLLICAASDWLLSAMPNQMTGAWLVEPADSRVTELHECWVNNVASHEWATAGRLGVVAALLCELPAALLESGTQDLAFES